MRLPEARKGFPGRRRHTSSSTLGIDGHKVLFNDPQGWPVALIETGAPIRELLRS